MPGGWRNTEHEYVSGSGNLCVRGGVRAEIRVLIPTDERLVRVGKLTVEGSEYVFRYAPEYADSDFPPIPGFPEKGREYRSYHLWPFFDVRLPSVKRADIQQLIRDRQLDEGDTLRMLGELGRKTITTPYELEYRSSAA